MSTTTTSEDDRKSIPVEVQKIIEDLKILSNTLQTCFSDPLSYPAKAETLHSDCVCLLSRLDSTKTFTSMLVPYGSRIQDLVGRRDLSKLDVGVVSDSHLHLANSTGVYVRALIIRLTHISSILTCSAPQSSRDDPFDKIERLRFAHSSLEGMLFEELSLLLVALSSTGKDMLSICNDAVSAFSLLCLAKDVSARLVVGFTNSGNSDVVGIYNDVFAALCALCDSVVYLGPRSQIFMGMGSVLLLSAVDHLTTFTKLLPIHPTTHLLKPALVRELYKHGTKLAKDGRTNDSVTLLVTLLEVSNSLIPQSSQSKLNSLAFEMISITNEALYIIAFHLGTDSKMTSPTRREEANTYLATIDRNIQLQRQSVAEAEAGYTTDIQALHSKTVIGSEVAKVKFAKAMIAFSGRDLTLARKLLNDMINMTITTTNDDIYDICLSGIRSVSVYAIMKEFAQGPQGSPDLFDALLAKIPILDREKIFKLKMDQVLATLTGLGDLLGDKGSLPHKVLKEYEFQARGRFAALGVEVSTQKQRNELQTMARHAVTMFSTNKIYDMCLDWCKVALSLFTKGEEKGKMYAEILAAQSLSLCRSSSDEAELLSAREKAREAVITCPKSPHFLAVWSECSKHAEFGGLMDVAQIKEDFRSMSRVCEEGEMKMKDMLAALSMMSFSCNDLQKSSGDGETSKNKTPSQMLLLIFVLHTWIKTLGSPKGALRDVIAGKKSPSPTKTSGSLSSSSVTPGSGLLSLTKAFLNEVEVALSVGGIGFGDVEKEVWEVLETPLVLLTKIRSRTGVDKQTEDSIFDDPSTRVKVGNKESCTWIAEQCWNLGVRSMSKNDHLSAAEFFAKAHDYGLLTYEEEGQGFTKGYLDFESQKNPSSDDVDAATVQDPCSLSSEFSFQCLMLSATAGLDGIADSDVALSSLSLDSIAEKKRKERRVFSTACRIKQCRMELETCEDPIIKENSPFLTYLTLRCAVETGDHDRGLESLEVPEIRKELQEFMSGPGKQELLESCALRAEEKGMNKLARSLWGIRAETVLKVAMGANKRKATDTTEGYQEYGSANRKLIKLCGGVSQEVQVFESVAETVCTVGGMGGGGADKQRNKEGDESARIKVEDLFHQEDLDWFVVESYNKGISLSYFGDTKNAEVLLRTSLNLLPFADKEVAAWGDTIRHGYSLAAESADGGWVGTNVAGVEGATMHRLFRGVTPN